MAPTSLKQKPKKSKRSERLVPRSRERATRQKRAADSSPYHHGALQEALLQAAERVLERDGLAGLTLRAVAREAGVSHAAPAHHFGDLAGLLSELAAIGFRRFNAAMSAAPSLGASHEAMRARVTAYVRYAKANPEMYKLMFRSERLDMAMPVLRDAANAAFAGLAGAIGRKRHEQISEISLSLDQAADIARAWSLVHGFTMLLLDGRLHEIIERLPQGATEEELLDAMLRRVATDNA